MPPERVDLADVGFNADDTLSPATAPEVRVSAAPRSYETPQFAFVPVGLSPANLAWIESLIRRLRERGDRQASRSKIIRALIERYGQRLEADLLGHTRHTPIFPSDHATRT